MITHKFLDCPTVPFPKWKLKHKLDDNRKLCVQDHRQPKKPRRTRIRQGAPKEDEKRQRKRNEPAALRVRTEREKVAKRARVCHKAISHGDKQPRGQTPLRVEQMRLVFKTTNVGNTGDQMDFALFPFSPQLVCVSRHIVELLKNFSDKL